MDADVVPPPLRVGIAYNLKKGISTDVEDIEAEFDSFETIDSIRNALISSNIQVELLEVDTEFVEKLKDSNVDIVFNIAEGNNGRGRESHIPAILNFLSIPFTGSDETTLAIALDKAMTKRYLSTYSILTPKYQLVESTDFILDPTLCFPLIIKPNSEGSGKGISDLAVVDNEKKLRCLVNKNLNRYGQPMLIEEYIKGREFTVGILGNDSDITVFEPMEIIYLKKDRENQIYSYNVKLNYKEYVEYKCPSSLDAHTLQRMKEAAYNIYKALNCKDSSRIDFRLSDDKSIYFIEINPLPGLAPGYSDYPMLAEFCGMDHKELILNILNSALKRYGMNEVRPEPRDIK